jgi:cupin 2 barrel domain protein
MVNEFGEKVEVLYNREIKVERISSFSNTTGYMSDNRDEMVYLLEGSAILEVDGKDIALKKDDNFLINKNTVHRVKYTSDDCKWLCIFIGSDL